MWRSTWNSLADLAAITFDDFIERQKHWLGHICHHCCPAASRTKGKIIFRDLILARSGDADRIIPVRCQRTKLNRPISDLKGTLQKPYSAGKNCHRRRGRRNRFTGISLCRTEGDACGASRHVSERHLCVSTVLDLPDSSP